MPGGKNPNLTSVTLAVKSDKLALKKLAKLNNQN